MSIAAFFMGAVIAFNIVDSIKTDDLIDTGSKGLLSILLFVFGFIFLHQYFNPVIPCPSLSTGLKEYVIEIQNDSIVRIYKYED